MVFLLSPQRLKNAGFFKPDAVQHMIRAHEAKERDHSRDIWTLLMFQTWYDGLGAASSQTPARLVG